MRTDIQDENDTWTIHHGKPQSDDPGLVIPHPEQHTLDTIALSALLARLSQADRELLWLRFAYRCPAAYRGRWPATIRDIGDYIGRMYERRPLRPRTVHYRVAHVLQRLRALIQPRSVRSVCQ